MYNVFYMVSMYTLPCFVVLGCYHIFSLRKKSVDFYLKARLLEHINEAGMGDTEVISDQIL